MRLAGVSASPVLHVMSSRAAPRPFLQHERSPAVAVLHVAPLTTNSRPTAREFERHGPSSGFWEFIVLNPRPRRLAEVLQSVIAGVSFRFAICSAMHARRDDRVIGP